MKKLYILAWMLSLTTAPLVAQQFFADTFYYRFDSYQLERAQLRTVDSIVKIVLDKPHYFEVTGHTDNVGTDAYNQSLSELRAKTIATYLIQMGVDRERVGYRGYGTKKAIGDNGTFDGRTLNRRADVAVLFIGPNDLLPEDRAAAMAKIQRKIDSLKAIVEAQVEEEMIALENQQIKAQQAAVAAELAKVDTIKLTDYEQFTADPTRNLLIIGPLGTRFYIPRGSFATDEKRINFSIEELFTRKAMLLAEVSTMSDRSPIETLGMIKLTANFEGTPIELKPDSAVEVVIPTKAEYKQEGIKAYSARGGSQRSKRFFDEKGGTKPSQRVVKISVRNWVASDSPVEYNTSEQGYKFDLRRAGWINVGRPLSARSTSATKDTAGINVVCKVGGKLFPDNANIYLVGTEYATFIPLKLDRAKLYMADGIESLDLLGKGYIVGVQYDETKQQQYVAYRAIDMSKLIKIKAGKKPMVLLKLKFKPVDPEEYESVLDEIATARRGEAVTAN